MQRLPHLHEESPTGSIVEQWDELQFRLQCLLRAHVKERYPPEPAKMQPWEQFTLARLFYTCLYVATLTLVWFMNPLRERGALN